MNLTKRKRWLRAGQVAARLCISPTRVNQLRIGGVLQGMETPLGFLFLEDEVRRLEERRRMRAATAGRGD